MQSVEDQKSNKHPHCADHLANERTFLAWVRTSLGLMAFGFVVERFSLFMKQIAYFAGTSQFAYKPPSGQGFSSILGIVLVIIGALTCLFAFIKYKNIEKQIEKESYCSSISLGIGLTIAVLVIAICLIGYLIYSYME